MGLPHRQDYPLFFHKPGAALTEWFHAGGKSTCLPHFFLQELCSFRSRKSIQKKIPALAWSQLPIFTLLQETDENIGCLYLYKYTSFLFRFGLGHFFCYTPFRFSGSKNKIGEPGPKKKEIKNRNTHVLHAVPLIMYAHTHRPHYGKKKGGTDIISNRPIERLHSPPPPIDASLFGLPRLINISTGPRFFILVRFPLAAVRHVRMHASSAYVVYIVGSPMI